MLGMIGATLEPANMITGAPRRKGIDSKCNPPLTNAAQIFLFKLAAIGKQSITTQESCAQIVG